MKNKRDDLYIIKDFFLLNWQENLTMDFQENKEVQTLLEKMFETKVEELSDYISILLTCNQKSADKLLAMPIFQEIILLFYPQKNCEKNTLQMLQQNVLYFLEEKGHLDFNKSLQIRLEILQKENILSYEKTRELISLLSLISQKQEVREEEVFISHEQDGNFYQKNIQNFERIIQKLKQLNENKTQEAKLLSTLEKMKNQTFSIGVTGVMNAGKSTLLNALLGKEVLGTSVVPETANLTVLRYDKTPKAVVHFWKQSEWNAIETNALQSESLSIFVSQTKELFGETFEKYVTKEGNASEIQIEDLVHYTSAKHSEGKCNLVKSVELYSDLKFLEDGVVIVDTPGLDDPVIQREEITKEYLSQCDLMIHLMNVNQSATKKDVDFLCDTLLYQNVSRLLVVITRIDTVSEEELQEVISYTKRAIKDKLISLNKDTSFDAIIKKIEFIPVASKMALLCKLGHEQEAKKLGFNLDKSGIPQVEAYLEEVLFGTNSPKAKIFLLSLSKELLLQIGFYQKAFSEEANLLNKNTNQIEEELQKHEHEIEKIKIYLQKLDEKVQISKQELENYFFTLKNLLQNKMTQLQNIIKRRVIDDISYEKRKNKQRPQKQRIATMIETGIKDGAIDVLREYRYNFEKKVGEIYESLDQEFENLSYEGYKTQDAKEFFQKYFEINFLTKSASLLVESTNESIDKLFKKEIELLDSKLGEYFATFFEELHGNFLEKMQSINKTLIEDFQNGVNQKVEAINEQMQTTQNILLKALTNLQNSSFNKEARLQELHQKNTLLQELQEEIFTLRKDFE